MAAQLTEEQLRGYFNQIDKDGNGFLSKEEVGSLLKTTNSEHSDEILDNFFKNLDTDKDGKISFKEFKFFYYFNESEFKSYLDQFGVVAQTMNMGKNLEKYIVKDVQLSDKGQFNFSFKTENFHFSPDHPTSF